jgi:hypothetical protein
MSLSQITTQRERDRFVLDGAGKTAVRVVSSESLPTSTSNNNPSTVLEYTKANINGVFGATTTIYATDPVNPPSTTPTTMTHYLTDFAYIDMTGGTLSNFILCRIFRNSSDAADTYTDSAYVVGVDAHVEFSKLGSDSEFTY